jgi:two-component system, NtrC family, response regulator HydG
LRERKEYTPLLAGHFIEKAARNMKWPPDKLTRAHLAQLAAYDWPGNILELQNMTERAIIERAMILAQSGALWFDFPKVGKASTSAGPAAAAQPHGEEPVIITEIEFRRRERDNVLAALNLTSMEDSRA